MSRYRNQYGRVNSTREARIEWIEARVSTLTARYTDMMLDVGVIQREFQAAGDTDAARIAGEWYATLRTAYHRAMKLGMKAEKHATRKRIERMQAQREDAWHKRMGWIK